MVVQEEKRVQSNESNFSGQQSKSLTKQRVNNMLTHITILYFYYQGNTIWTQKYQGLVEIKWIWCGYFIICFVRKS